MGELYQSGKPAGMRKLDVHNAVIEGVKMEAKFLALLSGAMNLVEFIGSWAVDQGPTIYDPASTSRPDNNDRDAVEVPYQLDGVMQIFKSKGWSLNYLADQLPAYYEAQGQTKARGKARDAKNLALSIQRVLLSEQECRKEAPGVAPKTRGIANWLQTTAHAVDGISEVPAALRPGADQWYTGTLAAFTEQYLKDLCLAAYKKRDGDLMLTGFVGIDLKTAMSAFTEKVAVTATMDNVRQLPTQKQKELQTICDFFRYDGVELAVMTETGLFADTTTFANTAASHKGGLFLDMKMVQMRWLNKIKDFDDTPDIWGASGIHRAEGRLELLNPSWMFAVKPSA